jgi:two-component system, NarL family, sensor histidine kinase UhpB
MSLLVRVFATNAAVLVVATLVLALSPVTVSWPIALTEAVVLAGGLAAMLVANLVLLRPAFAPLRRLTRHMAEVDLLRPEQRMAVAGPVEIVALVRAFNDMLDRLEQERRDSGRRAIAAQEAERARVASELHDEVGQMMTAVLMRLERLRDAVSPERLGDLGDAMEAVRGSLEDVRRISQELRPETLEHLGLLSAIRAMCEGLSNRTGLRVRATLPAALTTLDTEAELALYRIAQEALTNVVRHAGARHAWVAIEQQPTAVSLWVTDDGRGLTVAEANAGGLRGMRERAITIGGQLSVGAAPVGGVEIHLVVPLLGGSR